MPSDQERRERLAEAGAWLREQRTRRGFDKAADFARKLGIERYTLSTYETGRSAVPDERAAEIAEVLGMSEVEVRRGLGLWVPEDDAKTLDEQLDEEEVEIQDMLERARRMSREDRRAFLRLLRMADRMPADRSEQPENHR